MEEYKCPQCGKVITGLGEVILAQNIQAHEKLHQAGLGGRGFEFERKVAAIHLALGSKVELGVAIAGIHIDLLLTETNPSGRVTRTALECKAYSRPLGTDVVLTVAGTGYVMKRKGLVDKVALVSEMGFTKAARDLAPEYGVELVDFADLEGRIHGNGSVDAYGRFLDLVRDEPVPPPPQPKQVFVVMPFSKDMEDVYVIGIREVAEKLGIVVERADDIEQNEGILNIIQERISKCDAVIAETTNQNPNVFYEVGYSHALSKPTILIARHGEVIPFDLRGMNFVLYHNVVDLRKALEARLRSTLLKPAA